MRRASRVVAVAGVSLAAIATGQLAMTGGWEGIRYQPYLDVGGVWTVCRGHTGPDVVPGRRYSPADCDALFWSDMAAKVDVPLARCLRPPRPLAPETVIAVRDWAFNVGGGAACGSTLVRLLNEGRTREACGQLSRWVFVKGVAVRGLKNRRVDGLPGLISERALCLRGLKED